MKKKAPVLSTNRVCVVPFRPQADATLPPRCERVEYLVSGQAIHSSSWARLSAFIAQVLQSISEKPP